MVEQELPQEYGTETRVEGKDGHALPLLLGSAAVGGATLIFAPIIVAAGAAAAVAVGGGILLNKVGVRVFSNKHAKEYTVPKPKQYANHRCCMACKHPVEKMS